jgi:hypothetical protein
MTFAFAGLLAPAGCGCADAFGELGGRRIDRCQRVDDLAITDVRRRKPARGNRDAPDRRCPRLTLFDRIEGAGSAERQAELAMGETGRHLAGQDKRNLAGLEIGDLDLPSPHIDAGTRGGDRDGELRALHHGRKIRRFDLEMLDVLLRLRAGSSRLAAGW